MSTDPMPWVVVDDEDAARARGREVEEPVPATSPTAMTLERLNLATVARIAILTCACAASAVIVVALAAWVFLSSTGTISNLESFVVHVTGLKQFRLHGGELLTALVLLTLVATVVAVALSVAAAAFYNTISSVAGGVTVECVVVPEAGTGHAVTVGPAGPSDPRAAPDPP